MNETLPRPVMLSSPERYTRPRWRRHWYTQFRDHYVATGDEESLRMMTAFADGAD
jgi:hypothetical protein